MGYRNRDESFSRAAEYIADGLRHNRCITYASEGTHAALRSELAAMPGIGEHLDSDGIVVMPLEVFYIFGPGSGIVDAQRMLAKYLAAAEQAITKGYTGLRVIVDVTPVARTSEQRDALARLEHVIDQQMAVRPFSALCGYDTGTLGPAAAELVCLHPFVNTGSVMFRLYAEPDAEMDFALTGEIDAASKGLFATTLQRIWPLTSGNTLRIDAQKLEFITHQQLRWLDDSAREQNRKVLLWTNQPIPRRLVDLLNLTNVRVEAVPYRAPADEAAHLLETLQQCERQLQSQPAIEQVKAMLMQNFGVDAQEAFALLVSFSQDTNTMLREVAERTRDELTDNAPQEARQATIDALQAVRDRLRQASRSQRQPPPAQI